MQQVSPLHFQRVSKSSYLPAQEPATSTGSNRHWWHALHYSQHSDKKAPGRRHVHHCLRDPSEPWVLTGGCPCTEHSALAPKLNRAEKQMTRSKGPHSDVLCQEKAQMWVRAALRQHCKHLLGTTGSTHWWEAASLNCSNSKKQFPDELRLSRRIPQGWRSHHMTRHGIRSAICCSLYGNWYSRVWKEQTLQYVDSTSNS